MPLQIIDRETGSFVQEIVAAEKGLRWSYQSKWGRLLLEFFLSRSTCSRLYGKYLDSSLSRKKIRPFLQELGMELHESQKQIEEFTSFNDFFARHLKPESRPVADTGLVLPADGRVSLIENLKQERVFQIKGVDFSLSRFLGSVSEAQKFEGGSMVIVRLCPSDYHRFHFPCAGLPSGVQEIPGRLFSVNPIAIQARPGLFAENKRSIVWFQSPVFGRMALIDVGATFVGSIIQTYTPQKEAHKGQERGFFKFGGSTTVILFEPGRVRFSEDLLNFSTSGYEVLCKMGSPLGEKKT